MKNAQENRMRLNRIRERRRTATGAHGLAEGNAVFAAFGAAAVVALACASAWAANPAEPVEPIDPDSLLNDKLRAEIEDGEVVLVQREYERGKDATKGEWIALAIIDAAPKAVWQHIVNVEEHPEYMPRLDRVEIYLDEENRRGVKEILTVLWKEYVYHVLQVRDEENLRLTWTLDKSKENDIRDTRGGWTLRPYGEGKTLAAYQLSVDTGRMVPGPLERWLTKKDLPNVVEAVRKRSESGGKYKK